MQQYCALGYPKSRALKPSIRMKRIFLDIVGRIDKRSGEARLPRADFSSDDCFVQIAVIRGLTISGVKIPAFAAF